MDPFPFRNDEWDTVQESSRRLVNATLADDEILQASHFAELKAVLASLRSRYGEHPVLLETEADFTGDIDERLSLYVKAKHLALDHSLPTLSIRLSLARMLVEELGQPVTAREELLACRNELTSEEDDYDRNAWSELLAECDRLNGRRT